MSGEVRELINRYHFDVSRVCRRQGKPSVETLYSPACQNCDVAAKGHPERSQAPLDVRPFLPEIPVSFLDGRGNAAVAQLLRRAYGVTGKQSWWRVHPSSGGLHPLECYLLASPELLCVPSAAHSSFRDALVDVSLALLHYDPVRDQFLLVAGVSVTLGAAIEKQKDSAASSSPPAGDDATPTSKTPSLCVAALALAPWRTTFKYKRRGFRYYALDSGHALQSLFVSAHLLGKRIRLLPGASPWAAFACGVVSHLFDLSELGNAEFEWERDRVFAVVDCSSCWGSGSARESDGFSSPLGEVSISLDSGIVSQWAAPGLLSSAHFGFSIQFHLDKHFVRCSSAESSAAMEALALRVVQNLCSLESEVHRASPRTQGSGQMCGGGSSLEEVVIHRRSGRTYDPRESVMPSDVFRRVAAAVSIGHPHIEAVVLVNRVESVPRGLYVLHASSCARSAACLFRALKPSLQQASTTVNLGNSVVITRASSNYDSGFVPTLAYQFSGEQELARDGSFCILLFGDLNDRVLNYFEIQQAAAMVGHGVYLAAEACGFRANGMGYFDEDGIDECLFAEPSAANAANRMRCLYTIAVGRSTKDVEERFVRGGRRSTVSSVQ